MSTKLAGALLEDVEVSSVSDVGSLTSQLEAALKQTGATDNMVLEMTEEEKQKKSVKKTLFKRYLLQKLLMELLPWMLVDFFHQLLTTQAH